MPGLANARRLSITAALLLAAVFVGAGGCQALVDLDGLENRHCGPDEKACTDGCVPKNDTTTGCALLQCAPCAPPHATAKCGLNGECAPDMCLGTWRDCNQDPRDGCETDVAHDPYNCGVCGKMCDRPANGIAGCSNKMCKIGGCNPGWEDCDGNDANGCERPIWTDQECMTCNLPCPQGTSCAQGVCM
jgi:hypothetical protein